jgi:hypothetical protein
MNLARRHRGSLEQLVALGDELLGQAFEWGRTDCGALLLRALACIDEEGERHLELLSYSTAWGALKALEVWTPAAYLQALGAELVPLAEITAGDLVIGETTLELEGARLVLPTCHMGVGSHFLSSSLETGVVFIRRPAMIAAAREAGADAYRIA